MRARPNPINNLQESRRKVQTILGGKSRVWRFSQHHKQSGGPGRRAAGVHNSGINVLKHGRGRSYDALVVKADRLPFRVKRPGEAFFFEGDVSEVATLIEVDDAFVLGCADVIRRVAERVQKARPEVFL